MIDRLQLLASLKEIGATDDDAIAPGECALLLALLDRPGADLDGYRRHLAAVAAAAAEHADGSSSVVAQCAVLRKVLVETFGYTGDRQTYDDLRNANLMHVIDRRKGLPVALGILFLHAGRAYGGAIDGLNFPSHFLLRIESRGQRAIIDPFDGARTVSAFDLRRLLKEAVGPHAEITPDHHRVVGNRDILIRLQNNIKIRAIAGGDTDLALRVLETLMAIAPMRTEFWWEAALMHYQRGNIRTAIETLEGFLDERASAGPHERIETLLRKLRSRLN